MAAVAFDVYIPLLMKLEERTGVSTPPVPRMPTTEPHQRESRNQRTEPMTVADSSELFTLFVDSFALFRTLHDLFHRNQAHDTCTVRVHMKMMILRCNLYFFLFQK